MAVEAAGGQRCLTTHGDGVYTMANEEHMRILREGAKVCLSGADLVWADLSHADLSSADLPFANLSGAFLNGSNLSGANLRGADLSGAKLRGADLSWAELSNANLNGADLGGADLSGATLGRANLGWADLDKTDLSGANLRGAELSGAKLSRANFSGADLSGADLSVMRFSGTNLNGMNLSGAKLRGANLGGMNLTDMNLSGADLRGAKLDDAKLSGANLRSANLSRMGLTGMNLSGADLREANLGWAKLDGANLSGARLDGVNLSGAKLDGVNLSGVCLRGISLRGTDLRRADLSGADLSGADLSRANLSRIDLSRVNLDGANLSGTILNGTYLGSLNLTGANLSGVDLRGANVGGAKLVRANLSGTDLSGMDLSRMDLSGADLREANLGLANLVEARLGGANLTRARLWESQRDGWFIKGVVCESCYWDRAGKELTEYAPGEFERAFAAKPLIVLKYRDGITPVELAMLPLMLEKLQGEHEGARLNIRSVQDSGSGATITITVDDTQNRDPEAFQEEMKILRGKLEAYQRELEHRKDAYNLVRAEADRLKLRLFPALLSLVEQRALVAHEAKEALAVLFLDLKGFSKLDEERQLGAVDGVRRSGEVVLTKHGAKYPNTWGDAIVAGFDRPAEGVVCACKLVEHLKIEGLTARIGMSHGMLSVSYDQVKGGLNMDGPAMSEGARLEPLAKPGEVLVSKALRFHPEVADDARLVFTEERRALKKAVAELPAGHEVECWSARLKG